MIKRIILILIGFLLVILSINSKKEIMLEQPEEQIVPIPLGAEKTVNSSESAQGDFMTPATEEVMVF